MQVLSDLLTSESGLDFLKSERVFVSEQAFLEQLKIPKKTGLLNGPNPEEAKIVCSGQQVYIDFRQSVLSKFEVLRDIAQNNDLLSVFLWVDTDRTGSDSLTTKFAWPVGRKKGPITILPPGTREVETRFSSIDISVAMNAIEQLWTALQQSEENIDGAKNRCEKLQSVFADNNQLTLSEFNLRVTEFLLSNVYGHLPKQAVLSSFLDRPEMLSEVDLFVNCVVDVIKVFNETVESLTRNNINPQVKLLPQEYLPLFYSCEDDDRRLRLYHLIEGPNHFAIGQCKCGRIHKFYLGQKELSIAELAQTNRWSPDVCFPVFINDLVSGFLAGKSSALYLIVLNAVMQKVLGKTPAPILVPPQIAFQESLHGQFDSLIFQYLAGVKR